MVSKTKKYSSTKKGYILASISLLSLIVIFSFYNLVITGYDSKVDIINQLDYPAYLPGESFNLAVNVSCFGEDCGEIYVGLAREGVNTLYAASGQRGIDVYSVNDSGMINQMHNVYVEDYSLSIWGDENYIYSANGDKGISVYKPNEIGKPELIATDNQGGYALSVWGDGEYTYLANEQNGLDVYIMNDNNLELTFNDYQAEGYAHGVWGDGEYIYVAYGPIGLDVYQIIDGEELSHLYNDKQEGGYALSVWGDGEYIYLANEQNGLDVYIMNETGLNHLYNDKQEGGYALSVWGDGEYIYLANGEHGIDVYTIDEEGLNHLYNIPSRSGNSEAYSIIGNNRYVYLADGENGVEVYTIDEDNLVHTYNNYQGGYVSSIIEREQNGIINDFFTKPFFIQGDKSFLVTLNEDESQTVDFEMNASGEMGDEVTIFAYSYQLPNNASFNATDRLVLTIGNHIILEENKVEDNKESSSGGGGGGGSSSTPRCVYDPSFDWGCTEWSKCKSGEQVRECGEFNNCNTTEGRPAVTQACESKSKKVLFDVNLLLASNPIMLGELIQLIIGMINIGDPGEVNATIHYQIKDSSGNIVYEEEETTQIQTQGEFIKELDTSGLKSGDYTVSIDLRYVGQTEPAKAETAFSMRDGKASLFNSTSVLVFLGTLIILAILFLMKILFWNSMFTTKK